MPLLLLLLPFLWLLFFGRPYTTQKRWNLRAALLLFLTSIAFFFVGTAAVDSATQGVLSPRYLYREDFIPQLAVGRFGVMTTLRLDARQLLLTQGIQESDPEPTAAEVQETTPLTTPEPTSAPVVYGKNVMDIDFDALAEGETNKTLKTIDRKSTRLNSSH